MASNGNDAAFAMCDDNGSFQIGLTKREYFAAMAMQGILASDNWDKYETLARQSVEAADALINELNKEA